MFSQTTSSLFGVKHLLSRNKLLLDIKYFEYSTNSHSLMIVIISSTTKPCNVLFTSKANFVGELLNTP